MPKDFKKPEKTKLEKYVDSRFQQIMSILNDINNRLVGLSRARIEPEVLAKFMLDGNATRDYLMRLNAAIDEELKKINDVTNDKTKDIPVAHTTEEMAERRAWLD